ncbi:MAG: ABC transporter permease [Desulfurococcaceae archaeon TW002]
MGTVLSNLVKSLKSSGLSLYQDLMKSTRRYLRRARFKVGLTITLIVFILALIGPWIVPYPDEGSGYVPPEASQREKKPPSLTFFFGTDTRGRDLFSRVIMGVRSAVIQIITVITLSLIIGLVAGILAAYFKGFAETIINYLIELFISIPAVIIALVLRLALGPGLLTVIASLVITWWSWYARVTYVYSRSVMEMDYVTLARLSGLNPFKIMTRHVMRNVLTPVLVQAVTDMGSVLLEASTINFLGLGLPLNSPEWGVIMYEGLSVLEIAPWVSAFPGIFLLITALGFSLVGDTLREEIDPRLRRRWRLWF